MGHGEEHEVGGNGSSRAAKVQLVSLIPLAANIGIKLCLSRGGRGDQLAPKDQGEDEGDDEGGSDSDEEHIGAPQLVDLCDDNWSNHSCQGTCGHKNSQPEALWSKGQCGTSSPCAASFNLKFKFTAKK